MDINFLWIFKLEIKVKFGLTIVFFFSLLFCSFSQERSSIKIIDPNNKSVAGAHVQFTCLDCENLNVKSLITDINGVLVNPFYGTTQVYISCIGFKPLLDTLFPKESKSIFLKYETIDINEVVVTAQYSVKSPEKAVHKIKVIDRQKIESLGAVNLRDILTNETNVRITQDNVLGSSTSVQGLSGQNVKILIDGVPVIGRVGGNIDLSQINLNDIERIEIIEGPLSVEYGTNALAGTINLITKKAFDKRYNLNLNSYNETVGQYNIDGSLRVNRKEYNYSLTGGRNFFDGWDVTDPFIKTDLTKIADSTRFNSWKPKEQNFLKVACSGKLKDIKYRFSSDYFKEKITNKRYPLPPLNRYAFDDYYYTDRLSNNLNLNNKFKSNARLNMIFAYNFFKRKKNTNYTDLSTLESNQSSIASDQDTTVFDLYMARGTYSTNDSSRLNYSLGYDLNVETGKGKRIKKNKQTIGDFAFFTSAEYQLVSNLIIRPGLRYSYNTSYDSPLTPSLNLKYNINNWIFRGSYSSGFRAPSIKDLYFDFVDSNHDIQGNANLIAETSHNFSFSGVKTIVKKNKVFKIAGLGFYNNIDNLITLAISEGTSYSYFNLDKFKTLGAQTQVEVLIDNLKFILSGTYTGSYNSLSENLRVDRFSYSPELRSNVTYTLKKYNLNFSAFYKYSGEVLSYYLDSDDSLKQNFMDDFHTFDLTATKGFWNNKIKWIIGGKNLLNVKNVISRGASGVHSANTGSVSMSWGVSVFTSIKINLDGDRVKKIKTNKNQ